MSNVNTYRVIDFILPLLPEPIGDTTVLAIGHLRELVAAYDALVPTPEMWAKYPWATWYAIDANGSAGMFGQEPEVEGIAWVIEWTEESDLPVEAMTVDLPDHIDWRDCKWSREVTK